MHNGMSHVCLTCQTPSTLTWRALQKVLLRGRQQRLPSAQQRRRVAWHQRQRSCEAGRSGRMQAQRHLHRARLRVAEGALGVQLQRPPICLMTQATCEDQREGVWK